MTPEHTPWSSKNASSSRSHWKMCELAAPEERAKGNPVRQTGARSSQRREAAESPRQARCEPTQKWNFPDRAFVTAQKKEPTGGRGCESQRRRRKNPHVASSCGPARAAWMATVANCSATSRAIPSEFSEATTWCLSEQPREQAPKARSTAPVFSGVNDVEGMILRVNCGRVLGVPKVLRT